MASEPSEGELVVKCGKCGRKLKASARHVGRSATCPSCGAKIRVTDADEGEAEVLGEQMATRKGALLAITKQNDVGVVAFTSSRILDQSNVQQLGDELDELVTVHKLAKIVLNFHRVGYMSSAVMGKLVALHKKLTATGGELRLCNIDKSIMEIFKIMRFDKLFKISKSEDKAVIELMD